MPSGWTAAKSLNPKCHLMRIHTKPEKRTAAQKRNPSGPQAIDRAPNAVSRNQRRTNDPQIEHDVLGMARRTRSLKKTCMNLCLTQAQVNFFMTLQLADLVHRRRDGFGAPILAGNPAPAAADARRLQLISKRAA